MHEQLAPYCSELGRPSIDPELMVRMLIVGYCYDRLRAEMLHRVGLSDLLKPSVLV
jgi:Transposase domain (DUF772)